MKKVFVCALIASVLMFSCNVFAQSVLFEMSKKEELSKGVTYEKIRRVTSDGMLDLHVLKAPLSDPNITIAPVESANELGKKETVLDLLRAKKAVAGVNGDFFGLAGDYSAGFGPIFSGGKLQSVTTGINREKNEFASFFLDKDKNPFIMYLKTDIVFLNNGEEHIRIHAVNKVTDMVFPVLINRNAMADTASLDARFKNLVKLVVKNDVITHISNKGETVTLPENGYIIVMNEANANNAAGVVKVGHKTELSYKAGLDFRNIEMSIGGGGRILLEGQSVTDGLVINGRHPRTALGISRDNSTLILVVADGRTHSIGATDEEMAEIMRFYGAYNAMHLDGGGSSTMAIKSVGDDDLTVVNTLSDGAARRVIDALGVFVNAGSGTMNKLVVEPDSDTAFANTAVRIKVYGIDDYYNKYDIPREQLVINSNDKNGYWEDEYYYPGKTGEINILASYGDKAAECYLKGIQLSELRPSLKTIKALEGDRINISFSGIGVNAEQAFILSGVNYEVVPPELGHMEHGTFVAEGTGKGYIKCTVGEISAYVEVFVGGVSELVYAFEGDRAMEFTGYPQAVTGGALYSNPAAVTGMAANKPAAVGGLSAQLNYDFANTEATQAAYAVFPEALEIPGNPVALKMQAYGDGSGFWLRGRILDADGKGYNVDFAKNVDWAGFKPVYATIPSAASFPIRLERIYIASLQCPEPKTGTLFFDNLEAVYPLDQTPVKLPEQPRYKDLLNIKLDYAPAEPMYDITFLSGVSMGGGESIGAAKPTNYADVQKKVLKSFSASSRLGFFSGAIDFDPRIGVPVRVWDKNYGYYAQDNFAVISISAASGGIINTDVTQWQRFYNDIAGSGKDHVIIEMDYAPEHFWEQKEFELFQDVMVKLKESGKNIFVVSSGGQRTTYNIINGVRYINLAELWTDDGSVNDEFRVLRFRIYEKDIWYDLQKVN